MVSAKTMIRRGAYMAVCGADENVEKVLRPTGFNEIVGLYPDFASAAAVAEGAARRLREPEGMSPARAADAARAIFPARSRRRRTRRRGS